MKRPTGMSWITVSRLPKYKLDGKRAGGNWLVSSGVMKTDRKVYRNGYRINSDSKHRTR
ncbi:hypothetical protein D3C77_587540 [compost metagenome]